MMQTKENGVTLVSLVITIVVMMIIASTTVTISLKRFQVNNYNKMVNDLELLKDKVSNYYLKYNELPILRDDQGNKVLYNYSNLDFDKNEQDSENYYIINLNAMDGLLLNYGEEGFEDINNSEDVYIINEKTHTIYYVEGVEFDGDVFHYILEENNFVADNIYPTSPQIKVISGKINWKDIYLTDVELEFIPGKENVSGIEKTTYSINNGEEIDILNLSDSIYKITEDGTYTIKVTTYDNNRKKYTNSKRN